MTTAAPRDVKRREPVAWSRRRGGFALSGTEREHRERVAAGVTSRGATDVMEMIGGRWRTSPGATDVMDMILWCAGRPAGRQCRHGAQVVGRFPEQPCHLSWHDRGPDCAHGCSEWAESTAGSEAGEFGGVPRSDPDQSDVPGTMDGRGVHGQASRGNGADPSISPDASGRPRQCTDAGRSRVCTDAGRWTRFGSEARGDNAVARETSLPDRRIPVNGMMRRATLHFPSQAKRRSLGAAD